jgi:hypothetical protein
VHLFKRLPCPAMVAHAMGCCDRLAEGTGPLTAAQTHRINLAAANSSREKRPAKNPLETRRAGGNLGAKPNPL